MKAEVINLDKIDVTKMGERLKKKQLTDEDYKLLQNLWAIIAQLIFMLVENNLKIKRFMKLLFGKKSEKAQTILTETTDKDKDKPLETSRLDSLDRCEKVEAIEAKDMVDLNPNLNLNLNREELKDSDETDPEEKKPGHGRNGSSKYVGAIIKEVPLKDLKARGVCPDCQDGPSLYKCKPNIGMRIKGYYPIIGIIYELEKVRCSICQKIFVAELPKEAGEKKYDEEAGSMIAILKYGTGMPFFRLEALQANHGVPLPASTQWDIIKDVKNKIIPVYKQLTLEAAQGEILHNDDTYVKILSLMKEDEDEKEEGREHRSEGSEGDEPNEVSEVSEVSEYNEGNKKNKKIKRKGMFTTGILSKTNGHEIALYYSGRKHAGENLSKLLEKRISSLSPPIQMCDALARNATGEFETILANCLAHGRRNFVDTLEVFPMESRYVIKQLGEVYKNDAIAKASEMTDAQRLEFHQKESGPIMTQLKVWFKNQFEGKKVEPNSSLGKAIKYMDKHWEKLTVFLRVAGAPIDNNAVERTLKMAILNRKNAYFYKTLNGAHTGDIFMSIIQTCKLARVNAFEYLTILQKYEEYVSKNPAAWLPWNYKNTLNCLHKAE
jgi:hypothetical protein